MLHILEERYFEVHFGTFNICTPAADECIQFAILVSPTNITTQKSVKHQEIKLNHFPFHQIYQS